MSDVGPSFIHYYRKREEFNAVKILRKSSLDDLLYSVTFCKIQKVDWKRKKDYLKAIITIFNKFSVFQTVTPVY